MAENGFFSKFPFSYIFTISQNYNFHQKMAENGFFSNTQFSYVFTKLQYSQKMAENGFFTNFQFSYIFTNSSHFDFENYFFQNHTFTQILHAGGGDGLHLCAGHPAAGNDFSKIFLFTQNGNKKTKLRLTDLFHKIKIFTKIAENGFFSNFQFSYIFTKLQFSQK